MTEDNKKPIELFYDGACPLCRREVDFLKHKDVTGKLRFTDISVPGFSLPGKDQSELMAKIHAQLPDRSFVTGVEVFRVVYSLLGYRRCVAVSRWPGIRGVLDLLYTIFARSRPRLPGRNIKE